MGGMEKLLVEFARHIDRSRFELHFICLQPRGPLAGDIEAEGWKVTALDKTAGFKPKVVWQLSRVFQSLKVDLVHTHNLASYLYSAPACRLAGVRRMVHTNHGQLYRQSPRQIRVFRMMSNWLEHHVCISHDSMQTFLDAGMSSEKMRVIWNGIDLDQFSHSGPAAGGPAVLVARLSPEKNVQALLKSVPLVLKQLPDFRLEIAGDGPCKTELEELSRSLGIQNAVTFLGETRDVAGVLRRGSLFVLPSLTEGVSLTLLEAMACGLPIVATDVGGNPEVVIDGETGLLVPASNIEKLAEAIVKMMSCSETRRNMGSAGRRRVEEFFDVKRMVRDYEELYSSKHQTINGVMTRENATIVGAMR